MNKGNTALKEFRFNEGDKPVSKYFQDINRISNALYPNGSRRSEGEEAGPERLHGGQDIWLVP